MNWQRQRRSRVRAIRDRLREMYGTPVNDPHGQPIHELVLTVLSQNTNDRNRDVAYGRLRERFSDWEAVRDARLGDVVEAIRPGGLADTKAPRIQEILRKIGESERGLDLDWLEKAPREEAVDYLTSLPGVGRKTAACVMIFAFGRPEVPVDVHVYRVGARLGLFPERASFELAHDEMLALTEAPRGGRAEDRIDAYELHMNLIRHGREICRPKPRCEACGLRRMCPYWRERGAGGGSRPLV